MLWFFHSSPEYRKNPSTRLDIRIWTSDIAHSFLLFRIYVCSILMWPRVKFATAPNPHNQQCFNNKSTFLYGTHKCDMKSKLQYGVPCVKLFNSLFCLTTLHGYFLISASYFSWLFAYFTPWYFILFVHLLTFQYFHFAFSFCHFAFCFQQLPSRC